jgi:hypothetical protein
MIALAIYVSTATDHAWLWVTLVGMALLPAFGWIAANPKRQRFAIVLGVVVLLGGAIAWAAEPCPGCLDYCCQWLIPYGICWPIEWC